MKQILKNIALLFILLIGVLPLAAQNVTNVAFEQEGKKVKITYDLDQQADVSVAVSTDGGRTFSGALRHVTGGVGAGVSPGHNTIVWDVLSEYDKLVGDNICFRVTAEGGKVGKRSFTVKGVTFNMIRVEGGTFTMGATPEQQNPSDNEKPTHRVTLSSYMIGETEVTQELWQAVMGSNPSYFKGNNNPVEQVSWNDCQDFVRKLNSLTGQTFRLPTEAEWEFAARGGNKSKGYQYSGSNNLRDVAWFGQWNGNTFDNGNSGEKTHPVAKKVPNELGIYDMSGNVWEWCQDWYGSYSSSAQTNPQGPSSGSYRGGSWGNNARNCRSSFRFDSNPALRVSDLGLRLAL